MFNFIFVCLISIVPHEDIINDQVDLIEFNHFHNAEGRHIFDQIIFYDWDGKKGLHQIRAWRMYKTSAQMPRKNEKLGQYVVAWHDTQGGDCMRRVFSFSFRETVTQYDPELEGRKTLQTELRRELSKPMRAIIPKLVYIDGIPVPDWTATPTRVPSPAHPDEIMMDDPITEP